MKNTIKYFKDFSQKQQEKSKKILQIAAIGSILATWTGCDTNTEKAQIATLSEIWTHPTLVENTNIIKLGNTSGISLCNITQAEINGKIHSITAGHCIESNLDKHRDVAISENINKTFQKNSNDQNASIENIEISNNPKVHKISTLTPDELEKSRGTIEACYPDFKGNTCFKIDGELNHIDKENNVFVIYVNPDDYAKIFAHNSDKNRKGLEGTSGAPVFDKNGDLLWVLTEVARTNKAFGFEVPWIPFFVTALHDKNKNLEIQ